MYPFFTKHIEKQSKNMVPRAYNVGKFSILLRSILTKIIFSRMIPYFLVLLEAFLVIIRRSTGPSFD